MSNLHKFFYGIVGLAIVILILYGSLTYWEWEYNECIKVGHSDLYCITH